MNEQGKTKARQLLHEWNIAHEFDGVAYICGVSLGGNYELYQLAQIDKDTLALIKLDTNDLVNTFKVS